jgi:hypothetical protein
MRKFPSLLVVAVCAFILGCLFGTKFLLPSQNGVKSDFWINGKITDAQAKALTGSQSSSQSVARMYADCWAGVTKVNGLSKDECARASDYWSEIDAQNGNSYGSSILANNLMASSRCEDVLRSMFWAKKLDDMSGGGYVSSVKKRLNKSCGEYGGDIEKWLGSK